MDWDGPILTDSGGFQVVSLGDLRVVDEDGVTFRSHLDGSIHRSRRSSRSAVQEALGSDVAVAFDQPVFPTLAARRRGRRDRADPSLGGALARGPHARRTRRCSGSSRAAWSRICGRHRRGSSPRCRSTGSASAAWPATRRRSSATRRSTSRSRCSADDPRPRYLMGLGSPADLLEAVHRGVDLFDSRAAGAGRPERPAVGPGRPAQHPQPGASSTTRRPSRRTVRASLCRRFSRAYLAHLFRAKELLAYRLATCHNLTFTLDFMARIRAAIQAGTFPAAMPELRLRAGRVSGSEVAEKSA